MDALPGNAQFSCRPGLALLADQFLNFLVMFQGFLPAAWKSESARMLADGADAHMKFPGNLCIVGKRCLQHRLSPAKLAAMAAARLPFPGGVKVGPPTRSFPGQRQNVRPEAFADDMAHISCPSAFLTSLKFS